jgi:putative hemolysin
MEAKMNHRFSLLLVLSICLALLVSCNLLKEKQTPQANMLNPASVHCEENGGRVELITDEEGGVSGVCVFEDGSFCEEWAFLRGECEVGGSLKEGGGSD